MLFASTHWPDRHRPPLCRTMTTAKNDAGKSATLARADTHTLCLGSAVCPYKVSSAELGYSMVALPHTAMSRSIRTSIHCGKSSNGHGFRGKFYECHTGGPVVAKLSCPSLTRGWRRSSAPRPTVMACISELRQATVVLVVTRSIRPHSL